MKPENNNANPNLDSMNDDELERRVGLFVDGRLDSAAAAVVDRALGSSSRVRRVHADLVAMKRSIAKLPVPTPSRELLGRTLERVAAARIAKEREILVLPWIRGVAVAAALVIGANAAMFGTVAADSDTHAMPTIEDRFAPVTNETKPDSLANYLAWYFLGRER